jgi:hypothetical protein
MTQSIKQYTDLHNFKNVSSKDKRLNKYIDIKFSDFEKSMIKQSISTENKIIKGSYCFSTSLRDETLSELDLKNIEYIEEYIKNNPLNGFKKIQYSSLLNEGHDCELCGWHETEVETILEFSYVETDEEKLLRLMKNKNFRKEFIKNVKVISDDNQEFILVFPEITFVYKVQEKYSYKDILNKFNKNKTLKSQFSFICDNIGKYLIAV